MFVESLVDLYIDEESTVELVLANEFLLIPNSMYREIHKNLFSRYLLSA